MARVPLSELIYQGANPVRTAPGRSVFVYKRGTETKATLYSAETGETTITQPLTTNASGLPAHEGSQVWIEPGQYTFAVATSKVPVEIPSAETGTEEEVLTKNSSGAYKPRRLTYRNLMDSAYGASNKGEASMKAAFEAAVADCLGRTLYIPSGTYLGSGLALANNSNITIVGDGESSVLKYDGVSNAMLTVGTLNRVEGLKVDCNRRGEPVGSGRGIDALNCHSVELGHLWLSESKSEMVRIANLYDAYVHDLHLTDSKGVSLRGELTTTATVDATNVICERIYVDATSGESAALSKIKFTKQSGTAFLWQGTRLDKATVKNKEGASTGICIEFELPNHCRVSEADTTGGTMGVSYARPVGGSVAHSTMRNAKTYGLELSGPVGSESLDNVIIGGSLSEAGISINDNSGNQQAIRAASIGDRISGCAARGIAILRPESVSVINPSIEHAGTEAAILFQETNVGNAGHFKLVGADIDCKATAPYCLSLELGSAGGNTLTIEGGYNDLRNALTAEIRLANGTLLGDFGPNFGARFSFGTITYVNGKLVGYLPEVASAATTTVSGVPDVAKITGTTEIKKITATREGHRLTLIFTSTAKLVEGENLKFATVTPGANGAVTLVCDGINWFKAA